MSLEQYRQLGLIKFNQFSNDIYKIDLEKIQGRPFSSLIPKSSLSLQSNQAPSLQQSQVATTGPQNKPIKHGLCFILYPKLMQEADRTPEEMERKQA